MGLFGALFGKDPEREIARIEESLRRESHYQALEAATRLARSAEGKWKTRAEELAGRCREALIGSILAKAEDAEAAGSLADAADWIESALGRLPEGDPRRAEVASRAARLHAAIEAAEEETWAERVEGAPPAAPSDEGQNAEIHWEALVSMLEDEIAHLYEEQPLALRQAVVALNEGRTETAATILDALLESAPDDPVLRLERGRCRLLSGEPDAARQDFEIAWDTFGDEPLDLAGSFGVPDLWAEATLAAGDAPAVLDRLEDLATPEADRPALTEHFAAALLATERFDDARSLLARAASLHPNHPSFPYLLARALREGGEPALALECLETAVAPTCASGRCGGPRRHLPSVRLLAELHLGQDEGDNERALELLTLLARDQGGRRSPADLDLLARYQERVGQPEAARRLREEASRLREAGEELTMGDDQLPSLAAGRRPVL